MRKILWTICLLFVILLAYAYYSLMQEPTAIYPDSPDLTYPTQQWDNPNNAKG